MCGRYRNGSDAETIEAAAGTTQWRDRENFRAGYNASPTTNNPVVTKDAASGTKTIHVMRWGLIPSWAKDPKTLPTLMFNARGETVQDKPAFRGPVKAGKRCVVITDGFYEWYRGKDSKYASPTGETSQPYHVSLPDGSLMKMAGLYDVWKNAEGNQVFTYTIITIASRGTKLSWLHDRMPVILNDESQEQWLDVEAFAGKSAVEKFVKPYMKELEFIRMTSNLHGPLPESASRGQEILSAFLRTPPSKKPKREHLESPEEDKQNLAKTSPSIMDSSKDVDVEKSKDAGKARSEKTTAVDTEAKEQMKSTPESASKAWKTTSLPVKRGLSARDEQPKRQMRVDHFFAKRNN